MFTPEKIEEWIQEVKERPASAELIIQFIANRLRDLSEWNEELRAENLELRSGASVDKYERQIAHLGYQLEMLKRQIGSEIKLDAIEDIPTKTDLDSLNLIVYGPRGRILRQNIDLTDPQESRTISRLHAIQPDEPEPPRILIASTTEELMLIFTSGRIATMPVSTLPLAQSQASELNWGEAPIPEEPNLGETLACVAPISKMAMADFYLQTSRRGYMKKIRKALAASIMDNKYIGTGVKVPADQTLSLAMGYQGEQYILVSYEGYIQCISEEMLPYAIVEAIRVGKTDHLVAAFPVSKHKSIIVMTQIGKVINREADSLETATDLQRKGQMLFSTERRKAGVRVAGAGAADLDDWCLALRKDGQLTLHAVSELVGRGSIDGENEIMDFIIYQF